MSIELLIFGNCELISVLVLALFAENGRFKDGKSAIELAKLFKALVACRIQSLIALSRCDSGFPDQRF